MNEEQNFPRRLDVKLFLSVLATGLLSFTGVVIETSMNVTFPTLMKEFGISISTVQWITTGYLLILAIVVPASAFLKKRFTSKQIFLTANVTFMVGTVLGFWAPSFEILLFGRLLQGAGTGLALPLMFNIVMEQAPLEKIGMMMGSANLTIAMAPAIGPFVGGWIVNNYGWRMIFAALLPILFLSLMCGAFSIRQSSSLQDEKFPLRAYLLLAISFLCFILGSSFAGSFGWTDSKVLALFIGSFVFMTGFLKSSAQSENPLIHLQIFREKKFYLCVCGLLLLQFICLGLGLLIPNFAQIVLGENAFIAGCILLPGCLLGACLAPISGRLLDKFGAKIPILSGCSFVIVAMAIFNITLEDTSVKLMAAVYSIFTLGQGFLSGNTMVTGLSALQSEFKADGNAVFNTLQQLAGAIGTAVVAAIISMPQAQFPDDLAASTNLGSSYAFMFLLALSFLEMFSLWLAIKSKSKSN